MSLPAVSVVIPTWQRASTLERTLAAVYALDYPKQLLEILVVDDGSTDATAETIRRFDRVRHVTQAHAGVLKARNHGARLAGGDILMFLDDDIIVGPDNVRRHLTVRAEYRQFPESIVGGHPEFDPDVRAALERSPFGRFRLSMEDYAKTDHAQRWGSEGQIQPFGVATANMSISRTFFWGLGGFDEKFPSIGAEDQDLCWRARRAGCAIVHDYSIRVIHNDQHRDLAAICRREENNASGMVYFVRKNPDFPQPSTIEVNGPVRREDPPRLVVRKLVRATLSRALPLALAHRLVRAVEFVRPNGGWPLEFLYRALTGLYVFRGVRKGLRITAERSSQTR
jgi:glycosyltransferase involved in cell wall biosynthesis